MITKARETYKRKGDVARDENARFNLAFFFQSGLTISDGMQNSS